MHVPKTKQNPPFPKKKPLRFFLWMLPISPLSPRVFCLPWGIPFCAYAVPKSRKLHAACSAGIEGQVPQYLPNSGIPSLPLFFFTPASGVGVAVLPAPPKIVVVMSPSQGAISLSLTLVVWLSFSSDGIDCRWAFSELGPGKYEASNGLEGGRLLVSGVVSFLSIEGNGGGGG